MKHLILFIIILVNFKTFAQSGNLPIEIEKMGLVGTLVSLKMNAEAVASMVQSDKILTQPERLEVLEKYTQLRIRSAIIISQLISDLSQKNNIKLFKSLKVYLTEHVLSDSSPSSNRYIHNLKLLKSECDEYYKDAYQMCHHRGGSPHMPAVTDLIPGFSDIEAVLKDLSEARGKKVDKLIAILDTLKFTAASELSNSAASKKEDKKDS